MIEIRFSDSCEKHSVLIEQLNKLLNQNLKFVVFANSRQLNDLC